MVRKIYQILSRAWGPQHWWPAESPFEVIVGAILTQNTSWTNVERAMAKLREANVLSVEGIRSLPLAELEQLVRSSGYYRQKAQRLKTFISYLDAAHAGSLQRMFSAPTIELRQELLALNGVGQETADSILLYAANHDIFVVDSYARRVLQRHNAVGNDAKYDEVRSLVERALRRETPATEGSAPGITLTGLHTHLPSLMSRSARTPLAQVFNEMHGLFVQVGKYYCWKKDPDCVHCPLRPLLPGPAPDLRKE